MKKVKVALLVAIAIGALNMGACGGGADGSVIEKTATDVANQPCNPLFDGGVGNCPVIKKSEQETVSPEQDTPNNEN